MAKKPGKPGQTYRVCRVEGCHVSIPETRVVCALHQAAMGPPGRRQILASLGDPVADDCGDDEANEAIDDKLFAEALKAIDDALDAVVLNLSNFAKAAVRN